MEKIPLLDCLVNLNNNGLQMTVPRKPTHTDWTNHLALWAYIQRELLLVGFLFWWGERGHIWWFLPASWYTTKFRPWLTNDQWLITHYTWDLKIANITVNRLSDFNMTLKVASAQIVRIFFINNRPVQNNPCLQITLTLLGANFLP